jgi:dihydrofolate reductase
MRTVTYGAACTLDGFIAGPQGQMEWLHFSPDVHQIMGDYWKTIDTILMGRKTWDHAVAQGGGGDAGQGTIKTYVFSRTLREIPNTGVQLIASDPGEFVADLKQKKGKGICVMGGGELARSLFQAGVIDEVGVNIHPIILGAGVPLFPEIGRPIKLRLQETRQLDGGCVLANYWVASESGRRPRNRGDKPGRRAALSGIS